MKNKRLYVNIGTTATRHCPLKSIAQSITVEVLIYLLTFVILYRVLFWFLILLCCFFYLFLLLTAASYFVFSLLLFASSFFSFVFSCNLLFLYISYKLSRMICNNVAAIYSLYDHHHHHHHLMPLLLSRSWWSSSPVVRKE